MVEQVDANSAPTPAVEPHLSISAHVVVQLGEELVTDVEQALLELAKNAYDADSDFCKIKIEPVWVSSEPSDEPAGALMSGLVGRVSVRDNGVGIAPKAVSEGWLRISASQKRSEAGETKALTARGRVPVGDKGLGRLATMKIGRVLRLKTASAGETQWRTVTFSWDDFTQGRTLDQVPVHLGVDNSPVDEAGTIIEVIGLHHLNHWNQPKYVEQHLVPKLSSLINPFSAADNFEITVGLGEKTYELQTLDDSVLNLASASFDFDWDGVRLVQTAHIAPSLFRGERSADAEVMFKRAFSAELRPKLVDWLQNDKKLRERGLSFDVAQPWLCKFTETVPSAHIGKSRELVDAIDPGPFSGKLYYFLFHQHVKEKLAQANLSAAALQAMSQVAIFRDGFRVRAQSDWMRLSEGATSGSSFYGMRPSNVIGYFALSNSRNPALVEKSDREGFVDNAAHRGFMAISMRGRDFANSLLEVIRKSVRDFIRAQDVGGLPPDRKTLLSTIRQSSEKTTDQLGRVRARLEKIRSSQIDSVADSAAEVESLGGALTAIHAQFQQQSAATKLIAELSEDDRQYAARLLDAAAVGLVARTLSHELHQYVRELRNSVSRIAIVNKALKNEGIREAERQISSTVRELTKLVATIDPMLPGSRSLKENFSLYAALSEFVANRSGQASKRGICLSLAPNGNQDLTVRFNRTRFFQILENLYQNSLYWLTVGPVPEEGRKLITIQQVDTGFSWTDTGPGIRPSLESSVFDAYVSDKPGSEASGIGLHVVSTFLELERCSIALGPQRNRFGRVSSFVIDLSGAVPQSDQPALRF